MAFGVFDMSVDAFQKQGLYDLFVVCHNCLHQRSKPFVVLLVWIYFFCEKVRGRQDIIVSRCFVQYIVSYIIFSVYIESVLAFLQ